MTPDQTEAMVISDRIAVMEKGRIMQLGNPLEIYSKPTNKFVAGFMGTTNSLRGKVTKIDKEYAVVTTEDGLAITGRGHDIEKGAAVDVAIRPESIKFLSPAEAKAAAQQEPNVHETEVARASYVGELIDYQLRIRTHLIRARGEVCTLHKVGERVAIKLDPDQLAVLSR